MIHKQQLKIIDTMRGVATCTHGTQVLPEKVVHKKDIKLINNFKKI